MRLYIFGGEILLFYIAKVTKLIYTFIVGEYMKSIKKVMFFCLCFFSFPLICTMKNKFNTGEINEVVNNFLPGNSIIENRESLSKKYFDAIGEPNYLLPNKGEEFFLLNEVEYINKCETELCGIRIVIGINISNYSGSGTKKDPFVLNVNN